MEQEYVLYRNKPHEHFREGSLDLLKSKNFMWEQGEIIIARQAGAIEDENTFKISQTISGMTYIAIRRLKNKFGYLSLDIAPEPEDHTWDTWDPTEDKSIHNKVLAEMFVMEAAVSVLKEFRDSLDGIFNLGNIFKRR